MISVRPPLTFTLITALCMGASAGDLTPPGAPAPTMASLSEIVASAEEDGISFLPDANAHPGFLISEPGHYVLTASVTMASPDATCIRVTSPDPVIIDLNGHALRGQRPTSGLGHGIEVIGTGLTRIHSGSVIGFGRTGILGADVVHDMDVNFNGEGGVVEVSICDRVRASQNTTTSVFANAGIRGTFQSMIRDCIVGATDGPSPAISVGVGSSVVNCRVSQTNGDGIFANDRSTVEGCVALGDSSGDGIETGPGCSVSNSTAHSSGLSGFNLGEGNTIVASSATENIGAGFLVNPGSTVSDCAARGNGTQGFLVGGGVTVRECAATENGGDGFNLGEGASVTDSTAQGNTGHGISAVLDCRIVGNTCDGNGPDAATGSGIIVQGGGNVIDGNLVTDNDIGVEITAGPNLITRNTAIENGSNPPTTNFAFAGTNQIGPIIISNGTIATSSPWANFSQ